MEEICANLGDLVGNTPMLELNGFCRARGLLARILAKLEYLNPAGSIKDRVAKAMIDEAEALGLLKPKSVIIEPTSGNTGIGLASIAASRGYRVVLTMPETMSIERRKLFKAYGAEVVLTDGLKGMKGAIERAETLVREIPNAYMPDQFKNPANPKAHKLTTGPEVFSDTGGKVDMLIAGVGTGGTITGAGEYLKQMKPSIKLIAVEPFESPVLSKGRAGQHIIQGIGAGFVPAVLKTELLDEIIAVKGEDAINACHELAHTEGLLAGISSGAALFAAAELAAREENKGRVLAVIFPDSAERYMSTSLFRE